jgi:hypothetical protein
VSNDVRIGFGSFIEKPLKPFVAVNSDGSAATGAYSFRHTVSLTTDVINFSVSFPFTYCLVTLSVHGRG